MDEASRERRREIPRPPRLWVDRVIRSLRDNDGVMALVRLYERTVPLLFALFVAAPIGLVILPFFVPKFIRNRQRRLRYAVRLSAERVDRISGFRRSTNQ
jgi:hypothetical protein